MTGRSTILKSLSGFYEVDSLDLVDDQDVSDIMHYMPFAHKRYRRMYDKICIHFEGDSVEKICYCLWLFCRGEIEYREEGEDLQRLSSPATIVRRGYSDCKGYALFIGGVLDALNRRGHNIEWVYKFVPQSIMTLSIGHVFVVANPGNIWCDPVLGSFNSHYINFVSKERKIERSGGSIAGLSPIMHRSRKIGLTSVEQQLLTSLNEYALGMTNAISVSLGTSTFNTISEGVVVAASTLIPGATEAIALLKAGGAVVSNQFGPGSLAAKLLADINNNLLTAPIAIVKTLMNPGARTFESDQYEGARFYYYFVQGNTKYQNPNNVADTDVAPALKWFIDRLGVYISGNEHIRALSQSAQAYIALAAANAYTTTDLNAVNKAVLVAQTYFNFNGAAGSWAGTVGVFDPALIALANQLGESVEEANAQVNSGQLANPDQTPARRILASPWTWAAAAAAVILLLTANPD